MSTWGSITWARARPNTSTSWGCFRASGCELIADGVETQAERETLLRLGVRLRMGYLLGGPSEAVLWIPRDPDRNDLGPSA